jgi:hypothetical protein
MTKSQKPHDPRRWVYGDHLIYQKENDEKWTLSDSPGTPFDSPKMAVRVAGELFLAIPNELSKWEETTDLALAPKLEAANCCNKFNPVHL